MAETTKIEWTDSSWTPIRARYIEPQNDGSGKLRIGWHCEHASPGCVNCYAEGINRRLGTGLDFKPGNLYREERRGYVNGKARLFLDEEMLGRPLRWRKCRKVFVCSMTDLFADFVPDAWIDRVFAVMALAPQHQFQVLTKRAARMRTYSARPMNNERIWDIADEMACKLYLSESHPSAPYLMSGKVAAPWPLPNVWLGTSVEDRPRLTRIDDLRTTAAAVRFLSLEPLLEDLGEIDLTGISWVIVGGESGPRARPMHPDWVRAIRDQCLAARVPFFFKQWGAWAPDDGPCGDAGDPIFDGRARCAQRIHGEWKFYENGYVADVRVTDDWVYRLGKKRAGRLLDGQIWDHMPGEGG